MPNEQYEVYTIQLIDCILANVAFFLFNPMLWTTVFNDCSCYYMGIIRSMFVILLLLRRLNCHTSIRQIEIVVVSILHIMMYIYTDTHDNNTCNELGYFIMLTWMMQCVYTFGEILRSVITAHFDEPPLKKYIHYSDYVV